MKIQNLILITAMMLFFGVLKAQTSNEWQPVLISMDGTNSYKGVEATYSLGKCNNKDVVMLKLVNTNKFSVKAQWINVVVKKDGKELFGNSKLVSIKLPASDEVTGSCSSKAVELIINLSDLGIQASDVNTFVASNFDTTN